MQLCDSRQSERIANQILDDLRMLRRGGDFSLFSPVIDGSVIKDSRGTFLIDSAVNALSDSGLTAGRIFDIRAECLDTTLALRSREEYLAAEAVSDLLSESHHLLRAQQHPELVDYQLNLEALTRARSPNIREIAQMLKQIPVTGSDPNPLLVNAHPIGDQIASLLNSNNFSRAELSTLREVLMDLVTVLRGREWYQTASSLGDALLEVHYLMRTLRKEC